MKNLIIMKIANKVEPLSINFSRKAKSLFGLLIFILLPFTNLFAQNPNPNAALDATIQSEMNLERFPGASTIIIKDDKIVWIESYGYADVANAIAVEDTTVFLLASMSKVFTGTVAMQLAQSGGVDLDANINNYLPFSVTIPNFANVPITLRQLMTHSSSISDNYAAMDTYYGYPDPTITLAECMQRYFSTTGVDYNASANFSNNAPGANYDYSNIGTALSGFVTESASGTPFDDFCDLNIFAPLCMNKTAWHFSDFQSSDVAKPYSYQGGNYVAYPHYGFADYPDGQLRSTALDLSNFMIAYLNGGTFENNSILSSTSINEMWSSQIPSLDPTQGLNWYQEYFGSETLWGHNGGEDGVSTDMYFDPINNIGICVLTNGEGDAFTICEELYQYALTLNSNTGITPTCSYIAGIEDEENTNDRIEFHPNPTNDFILIDTKTNENVDYEIYSMTGELMLSGSINKDDNKITLDLLPPSMYLLRIQNETTKLIKTN